MIDELNLKFGAAAIGPRLSVSLTPVTVFVGPNNAGKSRVLIELENYCRQGHAQPNNLLVDNLRFTSLTQAEIEGAIEKVEQTPGIGELVNPGHVIIGKLFPQS